MAAIEDFGSFWVRLAGEISSEIKRSMQDVGQGFTKYLANLSTVMSIEGVSQVVGVFEGDPSKFRGWITSIEKYVLHVGTQIILKSWLMKQVGMLLVIIYSTT